MSDGRKSNGGHKNSGRKSKAEELKAAELGTDAIVSVYGSLSKYWKHIAKESKDSFPHLKLIHEYIYGQAQQKIDHTSKGEIIVLNLGNGTDPNEAPN